MKLFAIWFGKIALFFTRVLHFGSGTTFPGLLAEKIDKDIIKKLSQKVKHGVIVVTGTNGKTTTAKMLTEILFNEGYNVLHNPSGSNLTRGIASALIHATNIFGTKIQADIAVFEIDEATMPEATSKLRPKYVLVTNLFRDQLDRYGELDKTAAIVGGSLRGFSNMITILNGDDPLVADLARYVEGAILHFGLTEKSIASKSKAAMDSKDCLECGHELAYENRYFGHLGSWTCQNCGKTRPKLNYAVNKIELTPKSSKIEADLSEGKQLSVELGVPGLYNVYNALSAAAVASAVGVGVPAITQALRDFSSAFGRMEVLPVNGKEAMLLLVKNPTGANQSLAAVFSDDEPKNIGFILNDNFADGTDISWIWDVDFECFDLSKTKFIVSGIRAEDAALRLKYAGLENKNLIIEKDPIAAVEKLAQETPAGKTCFVLPTYTAMIDIRNKFAPAEDEHAQLGKVTKRGI